MRFAPVSSETIEWKEERKTNGSPMLIISNVWMEDRKHWLNSAAVFFFSLHFYSFRFKVCVCWCSYRSCTLYTWPIVVLICFFPFLLSIFQLNFFPSRHRTIGASRNLCIYDGVQQCDFARFELASQIPFRRCSFHVRLQKVEATNAHVYDIFFWNELRN